MAAGYSAEFGRSTGGLVNAITKSGTNAYRGSVVLPEPQPDLAENNAFGQKAAPTQQQFGGSIGGPVAKDKLFFFGAYEQQVFNNTRAGALRSAGRLHPDRGDARKPTTTTSRSRSRSTRPTTRGRCSAASTTR